MPQLSGGGVVCLGDLMLEWFVQTPGPPRGGTTQIVDMQALQLGGPAYNVSWYFSEFGLNPRLVGFAGRQQEVIVKEALENAGLAEEGLLWHPRQCDLLFAALTPNEHYSFYARSAISPGEARRLLSACDEAEVVILSGSRHAALRSAMTTFSKSFAGRFLAFNPSYAISEFSRNEFESIFGHATLVVLNQREAHTACEHLGVRSSHELVQKTKATVIVTQGARGAEIWSRDAHVHVRTLAAKVVSTVGAGDAFFAGFLHYKLRGESTLRCGQFGMTLAAYVVEATEARVRVNLSEIESRMKDEFECKPCKPTRRS